MRPINALLPRKDVEDLEAISERFKIPYTEIFRRGIFNFKMAHWTDYYHWSNGTDPPRFRKHSIREAMEEKFKESFLDPEYNYRTVDFSTPRREERARICFMMTEGDLQFLETSRKTNGNISDYLSHLIRKNTGLKTLPIEERAPLNSFEIEQYVPHKKITFGIRAEDDRKVNKIIDDYTSIYGERFSKTSTKNSPQKNKELTKSEIVVLAYHLFKKMTWKEQEKFKKCEEKEGKRRGNFKKISVSFSHIGYLCSTKERPQIAELRAALYALLDNRKLWALVDVNSVESVGVEPFEEGI